MKTPILGGTYEAFSDHASYDRCVNLYPEIIKQGGKEPSYLRRCPGLRLKLTVGSGPILGMHKMGDELLVVSGDELYRIDSTLTAVLVGNVTVSGMASIADNGIQAFIAGNPNGYIYTQSTGTVQAITDPDFTGAASVIFLDGYFVFNQPDTQKIYVTQLYDGTSIDALEYASAEGNPDKAVALFQLHREAWAFGYDSVEIYYDSGATDYPLARQGGAFIESGCAARGSIAKMDNALFWLGSDTRGGGIVYRNNGYSVARVSTHSIETAISQLSRTDDAIAFSYHQEGHSFYVLTFPVGDRTFVYDASVDTWHERARFDNGEFRRWGINCAANFGGYILAGDFANGNIYALDASCYLDNTDEQRWLRTWRGAPQNFARGVIHDSLTVDFEVGVGLVSGQGDDPQVHLRYSDDGGKTWSNTISRSMGKIGEYKKSVTWHRLGIAKDRVYELSGSDPVKVAICGADLVVRPAR